MLSQTLTCKLCFKNLKESAMSTRHATRKQGKFVRRKFRNETKREKITPYKTFVKTLRDVSSITC